MIIYLGRLLPTTSCGSSSTTLGRNTCSYEPFPPKVVLDAALHTSKDLAVSPSLLPDKLFPQGNPATFVLGVSARTSRVATDGRYPLPCSVPKYGCVRTFLPIKRQGNHRAKTLYNKSLFNQISDG